MSQLAADYERIAETISFIEAHYQDQPSLDEMAAHLGLSSHHFQRLFTRWAGISPKRFLSAVTHANARELLAGDMPVLDASLDVGLSGPGRMHDLFVTHEAMSPGEYKKQGAGLTIAHGIHPSPFGSALFFQTERGLAGLAFADVGDERGAFEDMKKRWPKARFVEDQEQTAETAAKVFGGDSGPIPLFLSGTNFQIKVWEALLRIPDGRLTTYEGVASALGNPKAVRAVGTAVGRNPISYIIPCHRVLRKSGALGGYHWGLVRKKAILGWEQARRDQEELVA